MPEIAYSYGSCDGSANRGDLRFTVSKAGSERSLIRRLAQRFHKTDEICETAVDGRSAVVAALQDRLATIEEEIACLAGLAARETNPERQKTYWNLAQDFQRDARVLRKQIREHSRSVAQGKQSLLQQLLRAIRRS